MSNTTLEYSTPPAIALSRRGKGCLAVAGAMLFPGLGHFLVGARSRALRWMTVLLTMTVVGLLCLSVQAAVPALLVILPLSVMLQIASWIDAYRSGHKSDHRLLGSPAKRYLAAAGMIVFAAFVPARALAWPIRRFVAEGFVMPTASMSPTVVLGDCFLVHKRVSYARWSIIAFREPARGLIYIKRIVGLPGERIELVGGAVTVNGNPVATPMGLGPYLSTMPGAYPNHRIIGPDGRPGNGIEGNPITLGAGEYYVLGDNSPVSADSRYWSRSVAGHQPGALPRSDIIGVATWTYWPPSRWKKLY